ncbi:MAG: extracellular solute-binding protein family 1, partial [Paenibacillus sp.]|nr:extracellular solute-binding protein family 1 [Paenibacillus sp.]
MVSLRLPFIVSVGVAASMLMLAAGCGKASHDAGKEPAPEAKKEPVELVFYAVSVLGSDQKKNFDQYTRFVQQKYPYISLKFVDAAGDASIDKMVASKGQVDIVFGSIKALVTAYNFGLTGDMSGLIQSDRFDLTRIENAYLDYVRNWGDGKLSLLPVYDLALALYYNKDLFDKFGAPYPKNGMTWEQIGALSKSLTRDEGGVKYRGIALGFGPNFQGRSQASLGYIDPATKKATVLNERWSNYLNTFIPFFTLPGYGPTRENMAGGAQQKLFLDGTAAMYADNSTFGGIGALSQQRTFAWDVVSLPELGGMKGIGAQPYPVYLGVSSTSKHREDAFKAISALLSDEVQTERTASYS